VHEGDFNFILNKTNKHLVMDFHTQFQLRQKQELDHKKNTIEMELAAIKNRETFLLLELDKVHNKICEINESIKKKSRKSLFTRMGNMLTKILHYIFKTSEKSNIPHQQQSHAREIAERVLVQENLLPIEESSNVIEQSEYVVRSTRKIVPTSTFINSVLSQKLSFSFDTENLQSFSFSSEESGESFFSEKDCETTVIEVGKKKLSPSSSWLLQSSISSLSPICPFEENEDFYEKNSQKYKIC